MEFIYACQIPQLKEKAFEAANAISLKFYVSKAPLENIFKSQVRVIGTIYLFLFCKHDIIHLETAAVPVGCPPGISGSKSTGERRRGDGSCRIS